MDVIKLFILKKIKGRLYRTESIADAVFRGLGPAWDGVRICHDEKGAPFLSGSDMRVSVSDTAGWWLMALSENPVGIDAEETSRKIKPSLVRMLHPLEKSYLSALSEGSSEWNREFLTIWTRKEALMKLRGEGLSMGLSSFSVISSDMSYTERGFKDIGHRSLVISAAFDAESAEAEKRVIEYDAPMAKSAYEAAADLLDVRGYTGAELSKKLSDRGYAEEEIKEAVSRLKSSGYINDELAAESLARAQAEKGRSSYRIQQELIRKGIAKDTAKAAASVYAAGDRERAEKLAEKLYSSKRSKDPQAAKAAVARKLASMGYGASVVYDILDGLRD